MPGIQPHHVRTRGPAGEGEVVGDHDVVPGGDGRLPGDRSLHVHRAPAAVVVGRRRATERCPRRRRRRALGVLLAGARVADGAERAAVGRPVDVDYRWDRLGLLDASVGHVEAPGRSAGAGGRGAVHAHARALEDDAGGPGVVAPGPDGAVTVDVRLDLLEQFAVPRGQRQRGGVLRREARQRRPLTRRRPPGPGRWGGHVQGRPARLRPGVREVHRAVDLERVVACSGPRTVSPPVHWISEQPLDDPRAGWLP